MNPWDPKDIVESFDRMPTRDHPLYRKDESIEHLVHYGEHIMEMLFHCEEYELGDRIFKINLDELKLLEQCSFRRDFSHSWFISWKSTSRNKMYKDIFISDQRLDNNYISEWKDRCNDYSNWRVSLAKPNVLEEGLHPEAPYIVFVERNFDVWKDNEITFGPEDIYLCLLSGRELACLMGTLQ